MRADHADASLDDPARCGPHGTEHRCNAFAAIPTLPWRTLPLLGLLLSYSEIASAARRWPARRLTVPWQRPRTEGAVHGLRRRRA